MVLVLMLASVLLIVTVMVAVVLDRGPFAVLSEDCHPPRPRPPAGRDAVRTCDDLQAQLRAGILTAADYRLAIEHMAAAEARRRPLLVPGEWLPPPA